MPTAPLFFNRELSWIEFNHRVLAEAARSDLPALERLKFVAITATNFDEFFMIRVGGLQALARARARGTDASGLTPAQQLRAIRKRVEHFLTERSTLLQQEIMPTLRAHGMRQLPIADLSPAQRRDVQDYFNETVLPVLTPVVVEDDDTTPPHLPSLRLIIACLISSPEGLNRHALVVLPPSLPRFFPLPEVEAEGWACVALEDIVTHFLSELFPGEAIKTSGTFRITRNGDLPIDDEEVFDLAQEMEEMIEAREESDTVRLETSTDLAPRLLQFIRRLTGATSEAIYAHAGPLDLGAYMAWTQVPGFETLRYEAWPPQPSPAIDPQVSLFDTLDQHDVLLHHPYESFDPVVKLIQEAAEDPDVLAIKQFLYRTGSRSRLVSALIQAAENGKAVTVLVELKARFDEARNLERAEELRRAGAQILYGVRGLKAHAKICLIVRQKNQRVRRYVHFGTGNYNEATARLYTDISYLTAREDLGADASAFFNAVTARTQRLRLHRLAAAPHTLRDRLTELIHTEAARAAEGYPARIWARLNSLQDPAIIEALYAASQAGVDIRLNVRGLCCLRPGVPGRSERIRVTSIVDRFLEHSRLLYFHNGGTPKLFISSADWMTRNLDKRLELLIPVEDKAACLRLTGIFKTVFKDNVQAWELDRTGAYHRLLPAGKKDRHRSQQIFYREARKHAPRPQARPGEGFHPHRPAPSE